MLIRERWADRREGDVGVRQASSDVPSAGRTDKARGKRWKVEAWARVMHYQRCQGGGRDGSRARCANGLRCLLAWQ
jgi:hypothetical protein